MLTNYHTHSTFCDGKNTPEEIVRYAIDRGFDAIGFSSHGFTPFDLRYCMKNTDGYIEEVRALQNKYRDKIKICLGVEEDAFAPVNNRELFDYIIGSCHYYRRDGKYYPIDSSFEYFKTCLELFNYDAVKMGEHYFSYFCDYILKRRPDMIGHYDLITKFDEKYTDLFLNNSKYCSVAEKYLNTIVDLGLIFEANTGAIARGLRKRIYPAENLLYIIKNSNSGLCLASDSHIIDTLDAEFEETRKYLKDFGFRCVYSFIDGKFVENLL